MSDWTLHAACKGESMDLFFPPLEPTDEPWDPMPGLAICAKCPVRRECQQAGAEEDHGIWGGETPSMRSDPRKKPQRARQRECRVCGDSFFGDRDICRIDRKIQQETASRRAKQAWRMARREAS